MQGAENIILYNTRIYEEEQLSPEEFYKKVRRVKRIRTARDLTFTFFPYSKDEIDRNMKLWEFVNGNSNALNHGKQKYFIVMMPKWLYLFLRYSTQENVMDTIIIALTGLYAGEPAQRERMEQRLERSILLKVKDHFENHFKEFEQFTFITAEDWQLADSINDDYFKKRKRFISKFDYFFRDNACNPLILPLVYPLYDRRFEEQSLFHKNIFDISLVNSYFSESDWRRIIRGNSTDELIRSGSEEEPWANWKRNYLRENRFIRPGEH